MIKTRSNNKSILIIELDDNDRSVVKTGNNAELGAQIYFYFYFFTI